MRNHRYIIYASFSICKVDKLTIKIDPICLPDFIVNRSVHMIPKFSKCNNFDYNNNNTILNK